MSKLGRFGFTVVLLVVFAFGSGWLVQAEFEFWPGVSYDSRVPAFQSVLGYAPGARVTSHAGLIKYLEALARAVPSQLKVFDYGKSWEGRRLVYVAVGSEAHIRNLEAVRAGMQKLADPRRISPSEADALIQSLPAIIWLGYGVHGNEISSPDAALLTAYHLLAARGDPVVEQVLERAIVLIDPTQNPDGRDRFVHNFESAEGLEPDASPLAAEHNEPWPGGRTNHYYFDLNRDWFALTQPETRGRVQVLQQWYPLVFVDLHEMGSDSTYYFAPEAVPYNPHLAKNQIESLELFGRNNAKWFDRFGFDYFTREVYDAFYPGYGASWPAYHGSVAMTYEQASVRGLVIRRSDQSVMHFRDSVRHHFVASMSTAETAARNREKLLRDFYRYRQSAIEEGKSENIRAYILPRRGDVSAVDKLAGILSEQGVEITQATATFRACGAEFREGTYVIPLAQPAKRLIRTLLDVHVPMEKEFIQEQERRRQRKLRDQIYDVTAWSLPLMYNISMTACSDVPKENLRTVKPSLIVPGNVSARAEVAYLVPWGSIASGRFLGAAWREGLRIFSTDKPFVQSGRQFPAGTLILKTRDNPSDLESIMRRLAESTGAEVVGTDTGWVEEGVNFGSGNVVHMRRPRIALAWDVPTSTGSAGATRFVIERQFGYPVTPIRTRQLASADLTDFQVLIVPDGGGSGGYGQILGSEGIRQLKDWVSSGGTLVALGDGAVSFLADPATGLLAISSEYLARSGEKEQEKKTESSAKPSETTERRVPGRLLADEADYKRAIQAEREPPDEVAGVLVKARVDPDHWLTAGVPETVHVLVRGRTIFSPLKLDKGVNAAIFKGPDELPASGYLWEENRRQLAYKPFVVVQTAGRGVVIGFTADPTFRAYLDGLNVLFLNAVFRGPAHARPAVE